MYKRKVEMVEGAIKMRIARLNLHAKDRRVKQKRKEKREKGVFSISFKKHFPVVQA